MEMAITAAAEHLGVSTGTVRRRIRRGQLTARQVFRPRGHVWMVELEVEVELLAEEGGQNNKDRLIDVLQARVLRQSDELDTQRREVQFYATVLKLVCGEWLSHKDLETVTTKGVTVAE